MKPRLPIFVLAVFFVLLPLRAEAEATVVSMLTCSAGEASYEAFGHTALRVKGPKGDTVYNFGVFNFNAPHFAWRFVLGETDYMLRTQAAESFLLEYTYSGRRVVEQQLALTPSEAARVAERLERLAADTRWTYRYNFLRDNCTTRVLRLVEDCLDGRIVWPDAIPGQPPTLRAEIDSCSARDPWGAFGQDLMLGSEVDRPASREALLFSPLLACAFVQGASVTDSAGAERPLVARSGYFEACTTVDGSPTKLTPEAVMIALLALGAVLTAVEIRRRRITPFGRVFDAALLLVQGAAGCVIFILRFFSAHPAVDSNRLVVLLNPLPLCLLAVSAAAALRGRYFPAVQWSAWLAVWLLLDDWFVGVQVYPAAILLFAWLLSMRGLSALLLRRLRAGKSASVSDKNKKR